MKNILAILKNNALSFAAALVALLAILAVYLYPVPDLYDALNNRLKDRVAVATQLGELYHHPRHMPLLSPDQTAPEPLAVFPTEPVIKAGIAATGQVHDEASNMLAAAGTSNHDDHTLLVATLPGGNDCLPNPNESQKNEFAKVYEEQVLSNVRFSHELGGIAPVSPDDIAAKAAELKDQLYHNDVVVNPVTHTEDPDSLKKFQDDFARQCGTLATRMQTQRALTGLIYLVPGAMQYGQNPNILKIGTSSATRIPNPGPELMWPAQLDLWIYDDVCKAIARGNLANLAPGEPRDVPHVLFKQLVGCTEPAQVWDPTTPDNKSGLTDAVPFQPAVSPTGRVSNGLYSVYSFQVVMDVETERLPAALRALEVGQFITIRNVDQVQLLDLATMAKAGFIYGEKPVVRVYLTCEELFLNAWFAPYSAGLVKPAAGTGAGGPYPPGMGFPSGR